MGWNCRQNDLMRSDIAGPVGHEPPAEGLPSTSDSSFGEAALSFRELYDAFGDALLPARSSLEVLADVRVGEKRYRFAAARVQGRLFRGLLAGDRGKVWADRFTLDEFVGIRPLISEILSVPLEQVEIVS